MSFPSALLEHADRSFAMNIVSASFPKVSEDWVKLKPTTPLGVLPMLEDGDFVFSETSVIFNYLSKKLGYTPASLSQSYLSEMINACCIGDLDNSLYQIMRAKSPNEEEEKLQAALDLHKARFSHFEKLTQFDYIVSETLSAADIAFFVIAFKAISSLGKGTCKTPEELGLFDNCPKLSKLYSQLSEHEGLQKWRENFSKEMEMFAAMRKKAAESKEE
eukprot:GCRY01000280.1.p1 GENE.GCRY01000280.1~~GCRY01000280.1.p1  ORF type:complete len:239 (+),score=40.52 GCRY01000280.1:66-719(+)